MTQKVLGKNVNLFLLSMVLLIVVGLVLTTVFYEKKFGSLTEKHGNMNANLTECKVTLQDTKLRLDTAEGKLETVEGDIRKYDELYVEKADNLESAQSQINSLTSELSIKAKEATEFKEKYTNEKQTTASLQSEKTVLQSKVASLESDKRVLQNRYDDLKDSCEG